MKFIKKALIVLLILIVAVGLILFFGIKYEVKLHSGEFTKRINPNLFVENYEIIGIKDVSVLVMGDSLYFAEKNIVLESGKIRSIDSVSFLRPEINYIDGYGKFLIPGLIDTHVHLENSKNDLYLYLANGVTSVFEMFGTSKHLEWKQAQKHGSISPRIRVSSSKIASKSGIWPKFEKYIDGGALHYTSEKTAREAVEGLKKQGYDALKLSSHLNQEIYRAVNDEASIHNIPVVGHLPIDVDLDTLYTSHQSQLAHVEEILKNVIHSFGGLNGENTQEFLKYLKVEADSIAKKLKRNNISVSTTIWLMESLPKQTLNVSEFLKTIQLEYVNPGILEGSNAKKGWLPGSNNYELTDLSEEDREWEALFWKTYVEGIHIVTQALVSNNATILVGTDANVSGVVPGFSLHDELQSLSNLGISNHKILRATTVDAARFMEIESGEIRQGYNADLLLLSKNPLEDIRNTGSIERVFFGTYTINKEGLDNLLSAIKKVNNENRSTNITEYINL